MTMREERGERREGRGERRDGRGRGRIGREYDGEGEWEGRMGRKEGKKEKRGGLRMAVWPLLTLVLLTACFLPFAGSQTQRYEGNKGVCQRIKKSIS